MIFWYLCITTFPFFILFKSLSYKINCPFITTPSSQTIVISLIVLLVTKSLSWITILSSYSKRIFPYPCFSIHILSIIKSFCSLNIISFLLLFCFISSFLSLSCGVVVFFVISLWFSIYMILCIFYCCVVCCIYACEC